MPLVTLKLSQLAHLHALLLTLCKSASVPYLFMPKIQVLLCAALKWSLCGSHI